MDYFFNSVQVDQSTQDVQTNFGKNVFRNERLLQSIVARALEFELLHYLEADSQLHQFQSYFYLAFVKGRSVQVN